MTSLRKKLLLLSAVLFVSVSAFAQESGEAEASSAVTSASVRKTYSDFAKYYESYFAANKKSELIDICKADIKANPQNAIAYPYLCWSLSFFGRNAEVKTYYGKIIKTNFSGAQGFSSWQIDVCRNWVRITAAEAYYETGDSVSAIIIAKDYFNSRGGKEGFRVGYCYKWMGLSYMARGEYNNAAIAFNAGFSYRPKDEYILKDLAYCNYKRGLKAVALENYKKYKTMASADKAFADKQIEKITRELEG